MPLIFSSIVFLIFSEPNQKGQQKKKEHPIKNLTPKMWEEDYSLSDFQPAPLCVFSVSHSFILFIEYWCLGNFFYSFFLCLVDIMFCYCVLLCCVGSIFG